MHLARILVEVVGKDFQTRLMAGDFLKIGSGLAASSAKTCVDISKNVDNEFQIRLSGQLDNQLEKLKQPIRRHTMSQGIEKRSLHNRPLSDGH